jgi:hypothetical protein
VVRDGARFGFVGADVRTLQAEVALDGPGSRLQDESAQDGTRNLHTIGDQGKLRLRNDRNFTRTGAFTNNGVLELDETTTFNATTNYVQGASGTYRTEIAGTGPGTSYGQLTAGGTANLAGTLTVIATYVPQTGDFFDVVVAGSSRSGTFSTVNATGFAVKYLSDRVRLTAPELRISDRTVTEGNSGSVTAKFRVDLSSPSAGTTTVNYQTADGSAKAPGDYATTTGTLTFAPGDTTEFADVPVNGDTIDENNETYRVTLSNPTGAEIIDDTGTGRITDDDAAPTVSVADAPNRPEGGSAHSFQVSLSSASGKQVKVNYATANGTASAPGDYTAKSGTLTFAAGQTTKTVTVRNAQDALDENDETFTLALSNPVNATVADGSGQTSILDDDVAPSLAISDSLSQTEGGPSHSFQVTLSAPSGRTVTVAYATEDGSAQAPGDYTAKSDTLTFSPGETTKTVLVASSQDSLDEASETFTVKLSSPVNATVSDGSGQGTITDDDPTPTLSISDGTNRFEGGPPHTFTITLSAPSGQQVTVDYATQDGTATAPGDYTAKSGTLTFLPGQTSKSVSVQNVNDALDEPNEMFTVALSNPLNATVADGSGATTILDND